MAASVNKNTRLFMHRQFPPNVQYSQIHHVDVSQSTVSQLVCHLARKTDLSPHETAFAKKRKTGEREAPE